MPRPGEGRAQDGDAGTHLLDATMFWSARGGGVRRYVLAKRAAWVADGRGRHTLLAPGARGAGMVDCGGLPIPRSGGYRLPWRRGALARAIVAQRPDLIEVGDPFRLAWAARDAAARLQVPAVFFCHSHIGEAMAGWFEPRSQRAAEAVGQWASRYLAHACEGFDLVLAPSRSMQRALTRLGVGGVLHQPLGVDTRVFRPSARDPAWRGELGLPPEARVLLYVGRFAPEKRLAQLAEAVARLGPPYVLVAIGGGPRPPTGAQVHVRPFEATPEAVARAMASADAFVHAGEQETFGLAALEAMACGTPVIARDAAGLGELIAGGCGFAVRSGRPDDWADTLAAAFAAESAGHRAAVVAAALERARAHDWREVLALLNRRYERLLQASRSSAAGRRPVDSEPWRVR